MLQGILEKDNIQSVSTTEASTSPIVAFDARPLNPRTRHWGVGVVVDNVIGRLRSSFDFVGLSFDFENAEREGIHTWPAIPKLSNFLFEASTLLLKTGDLYWGTNHFVPRSNKLPSVVTIHDLLLINYPNEQRLTRFLASRMLSSVRRANRVAADSQTTANDLLSICPEAKGKIEVIYLGFRDPKNGESLNPQNHSDDKYVVMLGAHRPRKNLTLAVNVIEKLREKAKNFRLVVTGNVHDCFSQGVERHADSVETTGVLPPEGLSSLLRGAVALLFPSQYEGFGLPMLEGMAAGCPVIALDTPINREIAGNGALLVAEDPIEWARVVDALSGSTGFRQELKARGIENLRRFSWDRTASLYSELFERVAR